MKWGLVLAVSITVAGAQGLHRVAPTPKGSSFNVSEADINNAQQSLIDQGDSGSAVVRAQILLARAHFSCGEIDGHFGTNLMAAARAFEKERGLPDTGAVDDDVWKALNSDTAPAVVKAKITPADVKGPFVKIPDDLMQQAKLPRLGYSSALEGLAEKYHASPELLRALNPHATFTKAGEELTVPNVPPPSGDKAARIVVSKSEGSVRALDESGKLLTFYVATIGSEHDPLPVGEWKTGWPLWHPKFHYNATLFWDAKNVNDRATIQPGPNNPTGDVWINLSKEHYGIHGTPEPGKVGHAYSHGCIRLTNWDATELARMVKPGTPVTLQE